MRLTRAALLISIAVACGSPITAPEGDDCMGLPQTRDLTMDGTTPLPSSTVNRIQDCIVAGKFGTRWAWFKPGRCSIETNIAFDNGGGVPDMIRATADNAVLYGFPLPPLPPGTQILGAGMVLSGAHLAETVEFDVLRYSIADAGEKNVASVTAINPVAAVTKYTPGTVVLGGPYSMLDGESLYGKLTLPKAGEFVTAVGIQIYFP
jgi:hypothetical protein